MINMKFRIIDQHMNVTLCMQFIQKDFYLENLFSFDPHNNKKCPCMQVISLDFE
jgi:hypothetical protein